MKEYKAYIFDIDLTLVNSVESSIKSYKKAFETVGSVFDESTIFKNLSLPLSSTYQEIENPSESFKTFFDAFVDEANESFLDSSFYDDSLRIIKYLRNKNKFIGIVTNRDLINVLKLTDKYGITEYFDTIITCDKVKNIKPNPEPILKALEELNISSNDCVYIGDAVNDYKSATSAAVDFIAIERYNNCDFKCDKLIHSFDELINEN